jgi:hypothetical protein
MWIDAAIWVGLFLLSIVLATVLVRRGIPWICGSTLLNNTLPESSSNRTFDFRSAGFWIGFFETLLIFCFVTAGEYSAIAIIVGAKEFVRKDSIKSNPAFYLLGTLVNVGIAVLFATVGAKLSAHY